MKTKNILLVGGVVLVLYMLYKTYNKPKVIAPPPVVEPPKEEKKTFVLNLTGRRRNLFSDSYVKDYNATQEATISPAKALIDVEL